LLEFTLAKLKLATTKNKLHKQPDSRPRLPPQPYRLWITTSQTSAT
jgi:hypothetical protein